MTTKPISKLIQNDYILKMKLIKVILTFSISLCALFGDYIVFKSKLSQYFIFRAVSDSAVHASIGFLSSILFFCHEINLANTAFIYNIAFCTFVSSLIDIDHVFVARTFYLKDVTFKQRGIFHCTTFWLLVTTALLAYSYLYKKINIYVLTWMLTIAYSSHHIRDANRRGLWMYPFGHTPPFSNFLYIFLVSIVPHIWSMIYMYLKPVIYKHTVIDYSMSV